MRKDWKYALLVIDQSFNILLLYPLSYFWLVTILTKILRGKYLFYLTMRQRIFYFLFHLIWCFSFVIIKENILQNQDVCCVLAVHFDLRLDVKLIHNLFIINLHTGGTIWRVSELLLFVLLRLLKLPSNSLNSVCSLDRRTEHQDRIYTMDSF